MPLFNRPRWLWNNAPHSERPHLSPSFRSQPLQTQRGTSLILRMRFGHCLRSFLGGHRTAHYKLPQFDAIWGYNAWQCITLHRIPYKGWRWYPTVICYGLRLAILLHFLCMLSLVAFSPVCEKLRWRQLCLACFQTSAGKAGHPWQEPNRSYVKLWICYATTEFINPQIDRRKPYYIPSSLSLVGHGWLEKGTVYLSSIELPNCFRIVLLTLGWATSQGRVEMALPCLVSCSKRRASVFDDQICGPPLGTLILSHSQKSICATVKTRHAWNAYW